MSNQRPLVISHCDDAEANADDESSDHLKYALTVFGNFMSIVKLLNECFSLDDRRILCLKKIEIGFAFEWLAVLFMCECLLS